MGAGRESSRREHIAYVYRAVTAAPTHRFSTVHPDGDYQAGPAQPHKQPAVRKPHPNTGNQVTLPLCPSALSTQLEAVIPSPP